VSRLAFRELSKPSEFAAAQRVAKAAWKIGDREVSSTADLIALTHAGALTAGVFEGGELLGFVHGFPRILRGRVCQHSHLLAVNPSAQGRGLSTRLKFFQRRWCLDRGIDLVTWTYDPLLVKNARLNLMRLRAVARKYHRDFYGPIGGIYGDLPTDRFEVFWDLHDPRVAAAARGSRREMPASSRGIRVEVPLAASGFLRSDPSRALRERLRLREAAEKLMKRRYAATAIFLDGDRAAYLFERM
jgi:chorismate synthase